MITVIETHAGAGFIVIFYKIIHFKETELENKKKYKTKRLNMGQTLLCRSEEYNLQTAKPSYFGLPPKTHRQIHYLRKTPSRFDTQGKKKALMRLSMNMKILK